eukprot:GHVQ01002799.1.p1 GENE.GHVQ01002799.1~~GHVQ01002799.1.p1  ORF type:complete len:292 (-),score=41.71 GHVQ01002799.1:254-1129(-)
MHHELHRVEGRVYGCDIPEGVSYVFNEEDWSVTECIESYSKAKTLGERLAWQLVRDYNRQRKEGRKVALVALCVSNVFGPALSPHHARNLHGSNGRVVSLVSGLVPWVPDVDNFLVDVRDVATIHIAALEKTENDEDGKVTGRYLVGGLEGARPVRAMSNWINNIYAAPPLCLRPPVATAALPRWLATAFAWALDLPWPSTMEYNRKMNLLHNVAVADTSKMHAIFGDSVVLRSAEHCLLSHILSCMFYGSICAPTPAAVASAKHAHVYEGFTLHPLGGVLTAPSSHHIHT